MKTAVPSTSTVEGSSCCQTRLCSTTITPTARATPSSTVRLKGMTERGSSTSCRRHQRTTLPRRPTVAALAAPPASRSTVGWSVSCAVNPTTTAIHTPALPGCTGSQASMPTRQAPTAPAGALQAFTALKLRQRQEHALLATSAKRAPCRRCPVRLALSIDSKCADLASSAVPYLRATTRPAGAPHRRHAHLDTRAPVRRATLSMTHQDRSQSSWL